MTSIRNTVNDRPLIGDFSLDSYVSERSGETVYTICDAIGLVYNTIFPQNLERFYADSTLPKLPSVKS